MICVMVDMCVDLTLGQHPAKTHPRDYQNHQKRAHLPMYTRMWICLGICFNMLYINRYVNDLI